MIQSLSTLGIALLLQVPPPLAAALEAQALRAERLAVIEKETAQLNARADRLNKEGHKAEAADLRARIEREPPPNGPTRFVPLPEVVPTATNDSSRGLANVPAGGAASAKSRTELQPIRSETAKALFDLANRAAKAKAFALADECLRGVIAREPDNAEARRLLGHIPHAGGWATPYAVQKLKNGETLHPTFGWVPADWVPHLDHGELPAPVQVRGQKPRWLHAEVADGLRRDWASGWQISTEHFHIQTNVPLSEAIAFGRQLEAFYDLFFSTMADVIASEPDHLALGQRFRNPKYVAKARKELHRVSYFATKEQFVDHLAPRQGPGISDSLGVYITPKEARQRGEKPASYFFRDVGGQLPVTATLYHEVSHQLLFESAGKSDYERNTGNYWVFEGLGTYFETLSTETDGSILIGGLVGPRIAVAQKRLLKNHEFIPIERLVRMSKSQFDGDQGGDVHLNYAEAMALAAFFMQYDRGKYRADFLDYVDAAYRGRLRGASFRTLEDRVGTPYATLDKEFLEFLAGGSNPEEAK